MGPTRAIVMVKLEPPAKKALDELIERRGMTQTAVTSRMVQWLVAQDDFVQGAVLGVLGEQQLAEMARALAARSRARS